MKKSIYLLCIIILFGCQTNHIVLLGSKIKQEELCADLGYGTKCNPFPYGQSIVMNTQRPSLPIPESDMTTSNQIAEILTPFLGGQLINEAFLTPNKMEFIEEWYDVHSAVRLDRKFIKKNNLGVKIPLNEILASILASEKLTKKKENDIKENIENSYKTFSETQGHIEILYHVVNLSGAWYNAVLDGNMDAKKILTYSEESTKVTEDNQQPYYVNEIKDEYSFVGGIGAIEYKVSRIDSLQSNVKLGLESSFGIPIAEKLSVKFAREVQRSTSITVPRRLDVVFVSKLSKKFNE